MSLSNYATNDNNSTSSADALPRFYASRRGDAEAVTAMSSSREPLKKRRRGPQRKARFFVLSDVLLYARSERETARCEYTRTVLELATEARVSLALKSTPKKALSFNRLFLLAEEADELVVWLQLCEQKKLVLLSFVLGMAMSQVRERALFVHLVAPQSFLDEHASFLDFVEDRCSRFVTYESMDELMLTVAPATTTTTTESDLVPAEGAAIVGVGGARAATIATAAIE